MIHTLSHVGWYEADTYSRVPNKRVGSNKHVGGKILEELIIM